MDAGACGFAVVGSQRAAALTTLQTPGERGRDEECRGSGSRKDTSFGLARWWHRPRLIRKYLIRTIRSLSCFPLRGIAWCRACLPVGNYFCFFVEIVQSPPAVFPGPCVGRRVSVTTVHHNKRIDDGAPNHRCSPPPHVPRFHRSFPRIPYRRDHKSRSFHLAVNEPPFSKGQSVFPFRRKGCRRDQESPRNFWRGQGVCCVVCGGYVVMPSAPCQYNSCFSVFPSLFDCMLLRGLDPDDPREQGRPFFPLHRCERFTDP